MNEYINTHIDHISNYFYHDNIDQLDIVSNFYYLKNDTISIVSFLSFMKSQTNILNNFLVIEETVIYIAYQRNYNVDPPFHCVSCNNVHDASMCPHLIQCDGEVGKLLKHTFLPFSPNLSNRKQPLSRIPIKG